MIDLQIISAFDFQLEFKLLPKATKCFWGFEVYEIIYSPTDLKHEGRKLLHEVINYVSAFQDVVINPQSDDYLYKDGDVSLIKAIFPWLPNKTSFQISEFGGGLAVERVLPVSNKKVWCVDYATVGKKYYWAKSIKGELMYISRVECLFHELSHIADDGDPLPSQPALPESSSVDLIRRVKEGRAITRTNIFRLARKPYLTLAELRSPKHFEVTTTR